jgi:hypothetical protein
MKAVDGNDLLGLVGLLLLGAGLWLWWPPAALMVCGGVLVGLSVMGAVARTIKRGQ